MANGKIEYNGEKYPVITEPRTNPDGSVEYRLRSGRGDSAISVSGVGRNHKEGLKAVVDAFKQEIDARAER
tara:strand:+ start:221 stop:433 length:213 start_codon:yes stop_codon:yes gene_type:complete